MGELGTKSRSLPLIIIIIIIIAAAIHPQPPDYWLWSLYLLHSSCWFLTAICTIIHYATNTSNITFTSHLLVSVAPRSVGL